MATKGLSERGHPDCRAEPADWSLVTSKSIAAFKLINTSLAEKLSGCIFSVLHLDLKVPFMTY